MDARNRWMAVTGIGLGLAVMALNFSMVNTAFATIQKAFGASILELQWMLNSLGIVMTALLVTMGRLADTYGRRRIFLIGLILAGMGCLIAGFAPHPGWIIAAQTLQGLAGAIILPVSQALISHVFPDKERGRAIGIWAAIAGVSLGLGPLFAGVIIAFLGWQWVFFVNVPFVILALLFTLRYVKETKSVAHRGEMDIPGVIFLGLTIASLILAVLQGPEWGWSSPGVIALFVLSCIFGFILVLIERKAPFAIIHPEFFFNRTFLLSSLANFCTIFFIWAVIFLIPLYFQNARGDSPLRTGFIMLFITGPVALLSTFIGKLYDKMGPKPLMSVGFCILFLSLILLYFLEPSSSVLLGAAACLCMGLGWVSVWGPSTTSAITAFPKDLAGVASGGFTTSQEIGGNIGLAITGTVFRIGKPLFMTGFRNAVLVLMLIVAIALIASLSLKNLKKRS